jgi:hypothetical protein
MAQPDDALNALREIIKEFATFVATKGTASEADTRAKLIDRVLRDVCHWPEAAISREDHVESGFIDYLLVVRDRPYIAIEAKKEGVAFTFPETSSRTLKLSGALLTDKNISAAIIQVRRYCDDAGIRYAVATNGYAWIVFRAIREDLPWREGAARIFPTLESVEKNFTEFWNLLSFNAIQRGALDEEFGVSRAVPRQLLRVVDRLYNSDLPLQRNRLHIQIHPLIQTIFEDIAKQDPVDILQSCYVHASSLRIVANELNTVIVDAIPEFLRQDGAEPVKQGADDAGRFGMAVVDALTSRAGQMYLVLGGIGSGKTTFIKRYQRTVGKDVLDKYGIWFHLDFLEAPLDPMALELFVWQGVLDQVRSRHVNLTLETRRNIKKAFADKIDALAQTAGLFRLQAGAFDKEISPYLQKWQENSVDYAPRLLRTSKTDRGLHIVLFIDNVDQLAPAYQAQVFVLAERITRIVGSITILSLREESYYAASIQRTLTAYTSRKFHIASPRFRTLITSRINYALKVLENGEGPVDYIFRSGAVVDRRGIADFLRIVENSIFEQNKNIARFIEALCFGNMRLALDMFTTFLTSGATDVDKMLTIYRRQGAYFVAFHEFVKSIMLGDRRYYRDRASAIMNVFDCGSERNASHLTCLRIVRALSAKRGEITREGQGFVEIGQLLTASEDVFDNREDVLRSLNRLVAIQLIEANTKSTESIVGASHVRVTSAGWYYSTFLVKSFAYLDLVLQDTPLNDVNVESQLRKYLLEVDNLSDRDDQKLDRMYVRFARVRMFLDYLKSEENREHKEFDLEHRGGIWAAPFLPVISLQIEKEINWILKRIDENRERYAEDIHIESEGTDVDIEDSEEAQEGAETPKAATVESAPSAPNPEAGN